MDDCKLVCLLSIIRAACGESAVEVEAMREVMVVETAVPQGGNPVVLRDLLLRATEMVMTQVVARPEALNFAPGTAQNSELWNLFEIDLAP